MKYDDLTKELIKAAEPEEDGYFEYVYLIARRLPKHLHEQLGRLVNDGPILYGDVISKSHRSELFSFGLAVRVCCKGEQGYIAATYLAFSVWKRLKWLNYKET